MRNERKKFLNLFSPCNDITPEIAKDLLGLMNDYDDDMYDCDIHAYFCGSGYPLSRKDGDVIDCEKEGCGIACEDCVFDAKVSTVDYLTSIKNETNERH